MDITHTANRITLTAKESVTINGGSSYTVWNAAGIRSGTTGSHTVHAGDFGLQGAKSVPVAMPGLPYVPENTPKQYSTRLNVIGLTGVDSASKRVAAELSFRAYSAKGELVARGTVDSKGYTSPVFTDKPEKLRFVLGDGDWGKSVDIVHT